MAGDSPLAPRPVARPDHAYERFSKAAVEQSIPERFEQQARANAERVAVKTRDHAVTFGELNRSANGVARAVLAQTGSGNHTVALLLENGTPLIAALLGVLKAGKICVPIDVGNPEPRMAHIVEDSDARAIVTNDRNLPVARELARGVKRLVNVDEIDPNLFPANLGLAIAPGAMSYLLYTSGSTGTPKGVIQTHRNILHKVMTYTNSLCISRDDRLTLLASGAVGQAVSSTFCALLNGARLCPFNIKEEGLAGLARWLIDEEITIYFSSATLFRHLARSLTGTDIFPKLRVIKVGSERVTGADAELYKRHLSAQCLFVVSLSTTETGNLTLYFIDKHTPLSSETLPVGYPVEDVTIQLLDDAGEEVAHGHVGEISVRSRFLSPGYWRDPERTRAAYVVASKDPEDKLYRTGDLGRVRPDGCVEHLGRKDFRVKVRGFRVELEEIEAALGAHAAVQQAVVTASEDEPGTHRLVAYFVATTRVPTTTELRNYLKEKLPDHMVPSAFVALDAWPLTSAGKVDRRALPAPGRARPGLEEPYAAPRTPIEDTVADIWADVLRLEEVGIHDNFLALGGDSLRATQVLSRIRTILHADLPLRAFLDAPTVAALAEAVSRAQREQTNREREQMARIVAELEDL